jgi:hypothetical protein
VTEIHGLRPAYVNNQVRYRRTLAKNLVAVRQHAKSVALLSELAEAWKIEVDITDFGAALLSPGPSQPPADHFH